MATELDLQTIDDGSVYLAKRATGNGFTLAVGTPARAESEVQLTRGDLLRLIYTCTALLAEDEV